MAALTPEQLAALGRVADGEDRPAEEKAEEGGKPSQATRLVALACRGADLFRSPDGSAFAAVRIDGRPETHPVRSKGFRTWLARLYYEADRRAPGSQAVQDALGVIEGMALYEGDERPVSVRLAGDEQVIYLDLGDASREVVRVDAEGWRIVADPPVHLRRPRALAALPRPERGGSVEELREFVNLASEDDFTLLVAFLIAALRPTGPYPLLVLHGEHGSAKTTTARLVRSLVDPSTAPVRAEPRDAHNLMVSAANAWILGFDNLSHLPPWLSDALCRLSTGGGFATRTLYSDDEETIFEAERPVILTGIEELATRGDLLDRSIITYLPTIAPTERRPERELWATFEEARPRILGALLDGVAGALRELPMVDLPEAPRMADFAEWVTAAEPALDWRPGRFLDAYQGNRGAANELTLEASPVAAPIRELSEAGGFEGTATELGEALAALVGEEVTRRRTWPGTPRSLSSAVRRIAPNLRELGVEVEFVRSVGGRLLRIGPSGRPDDANDAGHVANDGHVAKSALSSREWAA
jgi:hypothetical protein